MRRRNRRDVLRNLELLDRAREATWDAAYVDGLPDTAFAAIEGGGKVVDGKTEPRSLRHLPYKGADGKVDLPHLRNALARLDQTQLPAELKASARKTLEAAAKRTGVGGGRAKESLSADSFEGQADEVRQAWYDAMQSMAPDHDCMNSSVTDVFPDHLIVHTQDGDWLKVPYTRDGTDEAVTFGDPVPVDIQFVETGTAQETMVREAAELLAPDLTGAEWDARIVRFGLSQNKWVWTRESAETLLPLLEGAPVCLYPGAEHPPIETITAHGGPVPACVVGHTSAARIEPDGVYARVHIREATRAALRAAHDLGGTLGLSVDTLVHFIPGSVREATARIIKAVKRLISTDIVHSPSADGRLLRATAGPVAGDTTQEDSAMRELLLAQIREANPALLEGKDLATLTDVELVGLAREAFVHPKPAVEPKKEPAPTADPEWKRELAIRDTQDRVREALAASTLPDLSKARVKKAFEGRAAEAAAIEAAVREEAEYVAKLTPTGDVTGRGVISIGAAPRDKVQAALDRLFEASPEQFESALTKPPEGHIGGFEPIFRPKSVTRIRESYKAADAAAAGDRGLEFTSIRHAYETITGDVGVTGFLRAARAAEAIESSTWTNILANTLYRRLLMEYAMPVYNERSIAAYGVAADFRTKEVDILDYFPDIATVDPEAADYAEITAVSDAKVSYAVGQKGNILTITRKTIINDDLRVVSQLVGRLGRAARRTLAKFVWNFWIANGNYGPDATALFHSNHGNTGSTALSADLAGATEVLAKIIQLGDMTEQGSGEKVGIPPLSALWLDVPHALYGVADLLNNTTQFSTTVYNQIRGKFGPNNERINVNPLLTDTTDWGVHVDPGAGGRESIQVDFLQGREEPEFFLADQPTVGQTFVGDKIQYKLRFEFGGAALDFRGMTKNVVAGG